MEAIILHNLENHSLEPLTSYVDVKDLYIGDSSIFMETLSNLYFSEVKTVYFLVELYKVLKYEHLEKFYNFGKRESPLYLKVVGVDVDKMEEGPALREFFSINGPVPNFVLLYSNTLLSVNLYQYIELHNEHTRCNSKYCMTVLFVQDEDKRFCHPDNNSVVLYDDKNELLFMSDDDLLSLDINLLNYVKPNGQIKVRYDLYQSSIYLCTNSLIENFLEFFDQSSLRQLISGLLTQEIKTREVYLSILKNDPSFPNYPSALKVNSPRLYYNTYMEFVKRFHTHSKKHKNDSNPKFGPLINQGSYFNNNSAISSHSNNFDGLKDSVFESIVGANVKVGRNSKIYKSFLFDNVAVGNNCTIVGSILMDNSTIMDNIELKQGSIVGSGSTVNQNYSKPIKCSEFQTKFIDLTSDYCPEVMKDGEKTLGYVWDVEPFMSDVVLDKIGENFYDCINFTLPQLESESEDELGSFYDEFSEEGDEDEVPEDFKFELPGMVVECLENPTHLENKLLEIRSLRVAHNVSERELMKLLYSTGVKWVIDHCEDEEDLTDLIEDSKFDKLLNSFKGNVLNSEFFSETLEMCRQLGKNNLYFCKLCESLYHTDVLDFTGFGEWVLSKNIEEPRLQSFAEWLESD